MRLTGMLASVSNLEEALKALNAGVDIIDLKEPARGSLGALDTKSVRAIVKRIGGRRPVSATIGDIPVDPEPVRRAVSAMAETGVDYIKIGFFPGVAWSATIDALAVLAEKGIRLIAVLFADTKPDLGVIEKLAGAGFAGAMLDTMEKSRGSLREVYSPAEVLAFVRKVESLHLLCGLAGSLKEGDIAPLLAFGPDYLGFRGALCRRGTRTEEIDPAALARVRSRIDSRPQRERLTSAYPEAEPAPLR